MSSLNRLMRKSIYFENLDGLRFLCFLSVFLFHSFHTEFSELKDDQIYLFFKKAIFGNGNLGVNFFFVLSGFLITYLLIEEKKCDGKINIINFWIRRSLRIWPLFLFCVFFGFIIFPFLKELFGKKPNETAHFVYYALFINNFDLIKQGLPDASVLGVLWSIAIEEQFYFVWPIILAYIPIKYYWIPFTFIIIVSLVFRGFNDLSIMHEYHTLSCIGDLAVGAFGAWAVQIDSGLKTKIINLSKPKIATIYIVFIIAFLFRDELLYKLYSVRIFERMLIAIIILLIILEQNYSCNSYFKMNRFKTITHLGIISYGLYCLHFIGILITTTITNKININTQLWQVMVLETFFALLITIILSKISYLFFETPFLNLKSKFSFITRK